MIFCNPNAGFYEFSFFQSEWFEFYMRLGVNLMLWNYQGYGRSKGSPSLKKILIHGQAIVTYLRSHKNASVIGIHGESLGGCIATHIANHCNLNFLFADRTFSSLSSAAYFNFGKIAYLGFKIVAGDDSDSVKNYLESKCYKILSCDPKDMMINDLASLKVGVAASLLYKKFPKTHILFEDQMKTFYKALVRIQDLLLKLNQIESLNKESPSHLGTSTYQPLKEDSELFENDGFKLALQKIKSLLGSISAGGVPLLHSLKGKNPYKSLVAWFMVLDVWGNCSNYSRINPLQTAIDNLKNIVGELELLFEVNGVSKEVNAIHLALDMVLNHIKSRIDTSDSRSITTSNEFKNDIEYEKAGVLIPLNCGHGGPYSSQERFTYERHLIKSRFINSN